MRPARSHLGWWAFIVLRLSGVALAVFLPLHFYVLGTALRGESALGEFLRWSEQPLVVAAEWVLIVLLAAHLGGGLRVLALEFLPWQNWQKTLAVAAATFALVAGLVFALSR
jgi:fumarate reductase subunit D